MGRWALSLASDPLSGHNRRMIDEGSEGPGFIFMGTGPTRFAANAPFPAGHELAQGDFVKADMGASCLGYTADFVRSYFVGRCPESADDLWRRMTEVQLEIAHSIRPGQTAGEIYERGVAVITIGHGIGLMLNEEPRLNAGNAVEIEPDTVMCLEFSAYLEGGARPHLEDMIRVTERGVEIWTKDCPRELVVPV